MSARTARERADYAAALGARTLTRDEVQAIADGTTSARLRNASKTARRAAAEAIERGSSPELADDIAALMDATGDGLA